MALLKTLEIKNTGVFAQYWKISELSINWFTKYAVVVLYGFKDQEARETGKMPLDSRVFEFPPTMFPFTPNGEVLPEAYAAVKNYTYTSPDGQTMASEFADAQDV